MPSSWPQSLAWKKLLDCLQPTSASPWTLGPYRCMWQQSASCTTPLGTRALLPGTRCWDLPSGVPNASRGPFTSGLHDCHWLWKGWVTSWKKIIFWCSGQPYLWVLWFLEGQQIYCQVLLTLGSILPVEISAGPERASTSSSSGQRPNRWARVPLSALGVPRAGTRVQWQQWRST